MTTDINHEQTARTPTPFQPTALDEYQMLLAKKHDSTVLGGRCDEFDPDYTDEGDHIRLYCASCRIVLDRKRRDTGGEV